MPRIPRRSTALKASSRPKPARAAPRNVVPMILKTFEVLEAFREKTQGLAYMELIDRFHHISKVSVYRILCSLENLGYLRKDEQTAKYQLGAKFIELGRITERQQDLVRIALPYMGRILSRYGENVNLTKLQDGELVYLKVIEGIHPIRVAEMTNRRLAIYCSGAGKALLASLPDQERKQIVEQLNFSSLTPNTIREKQELYAEIERIRKQGYALDNEENLIGVRCVAVPVRGPDGRAVAAISITGPTARVSEAREAEIGEFLVSIADELTRRELGYQPRQTEQ